MDFIVVFDLRILLLSSDGQNEAMDEQTPSVGFRLTNAKLALLISLMFVTSKLFDAGVASLMFYFEHKSLVETMNGKDGTGGLKDAVLKLDKLTGQIDTRLSGEWTERTSGDQMLQKQITEIKARLDSLVKPTEIQTQK